MTLLLSFSDVVFEWIGLASLSSICPMLHACGLYLYERFMILKNMANRKCNTIAFTQWSFLGSMLTSMRKNGSIWMENGNSDETGNNHIYCVKQRRPCAINRKNRCIYADSNSTAHFLILIAHTNYVECKFTKARTMYENTG